MADIWGIIKRAFVGRSEPEYRPAAQGTQRGAAAAPAFRQENQDRPPGQPSDFFPTAVGCSWDYMIEVSGGPLYFRQLIRPVGDGRVGVTVRGRFAPVLHDRARRQFQLKIGVAQRAEAQGPLKYPGGVELSVETDDLGVYEEHLKVFWAIASHQRFEAIKVITYLDHIDGSRQLWLHAILLQMVPMRECSK
jgi:hypothetical protein